MNPLYVFVDKVDLVSKSSFCKIDFKLKSLFCTKSSFCKIDFGSKSLFCKIDFKSKSLVCIKSSFCKLDFGSKSLFCSIDFRSESLFCKTVSETGFGSKPRFLLKLVSCSYHSSKGISSRMFSNSSSSISRWFENNFCLKIKSSSSSSSSSDEDSVSLLTKLVFCCFCFTHSSTRGGNLFLFVSSGM
ncbi:hypothetical protein Fmac_010964 [Flemingia macrophylla]|uniref:Uncharacterized protein n=1 Tax=Flemingia macrophylla TaxID=520843 RepID=A0ABD1ML42_9FABA